jgi:pimeloyl-ACP methyl ester carboxylesterase
MRASIACAAAVLGCFALGSLTSIRAGAASDDGQQLLTIDHFVRSTAKVPALAGQSPQIYVRERVMAGTALRGAPTAERVVIFVHGAGTPAEVAFDVPFRDYSWMGYLARAGFDTFSLDVTGYGRSTRPAPMADPCNLAAAAQATFVPRLVAGPCTPSYPHQLTTLGTDWDDVGSVVDYVRALRHVDSVSLVAWSMGGPRSGGYTVLHPEKVQKLVLLAPAYNANASATAPARLPADGTPLNTQSHQEFVANWDRQVGCPAQYDQEVSDAVWADMLASDPVGATWGTGVRRAPNTTSWGWNQAAVAKMQTPTLMISGVHDKQVPPDRVRQLYTDLGSKEKVFVDLACSSHNAMWEKNHLLLFKASLEWLTSTTVNGAKDGLLKMGY